MQFLRKFVVFLASAGLIFCLFMIAISLTARYTVMNREQVSSWLNNSGVYDNFIDQVATAVETKQGDKQPSQPADGENNIDAVVITKAARVALPPDTLKTNVEAVLNGVYDWLEGSTTTIVFKLDLAEAKQKFAEAVGNEALAKAVALPPCPSGEIPTDFDPFNATCLPSGVNLETEVQKIKTELATNQDFLPDTEVTSEDVKIGEGSQKTIAETYANIPKIYQYAKETVWIFVIIAIIDIILIILLTRPRRKSTKILAWMFGVPGVIFMLFGVSQLLLNNSTITTISNKTGDSGITEAIVVPLIKEVSNSYVMWNLLFGSIYLGIMIACIIIGIILTPKKQKIEQPVDPTPPIDDSPKQKTTPKEPTIIGGKPTKSSNGADKKIQG